MWKIEREGEILISNTNVLEYAEFHKEILNERNQSISLVIQITI